MLDGLNAAIQYIEEHLADEIDYGQAAGYAHCSEYHFKRLFSAVVGMPMSEYIRRRRMTLAALEIRDSEARLIDIAIKYGYRSADAFSRAFSGIHGVLPSEARNQSVSLNAHPRIQFQMTVQGKAQLHYRIVDRPAFRIVGMGEEVSMETSVFHITLFERIDEDSLNEQLKSLEDEPVFPGILHVTRCITDERSRYIVAVSTRETAPEGYESHELADATWVVFSLDRPTTECMLETWERIYTEWFPDGDFEVADAPEFIRCTHEDAAWEIWIPITRATQDKK
ncbi:AraC family transcriptional regulator [Paenibacillus sp. p3-SID867]|uniref:AraC family transcriptional regulator n=1 Tax=Paenibacillus sp. p3-SID867 TaxID=2916363 RepID=UPI0021A2B6D4|nr:AraC family transcriptional regulator [Paenibacillus sp. p3-SID867]MCT1403702.1 AraC family transcriptional regulator [Paenibacillus sp. p3-SID867]